MKLKVWIPWVLLILLFGACLEGSEGEKKEKKKPNRPLAGYTVLLIEPFTIERNAATASFPEGEVVAVEKSTLDQVRQPGLFSQVIELRGNTAPSPTNGEIPAGNSRRLVLTSTIIAYEKGDSTARFVMWPLPVGVSKLKVRFVFRDADTNQVVFQTEQAGRFQATWSGGIAGKDQQLREVKNQVADAFVKTIRQNR
jgi:hypothetical protein